MIVHIYTELVSGPDDFVGAVAYSLYKQTKVEWMVTYKASHGGTEPTPAERVAFREFNVLPAQLQGYQDRAESLVSDFLAAATQERVNIISNETQRGALANKFEATHQLVANAITSMRTEIARKRGFSGWSADIVITLFVNILTIVVVGAIAIGADKLGAFNSLLEKSLKAQAAPATSPPPPAAGTPPGS